MRENNELKREEVSVIFVSHRNRSRRNGTNATPVFTTLNRYAKPVKKSEIISLDEDDTIAIVTRKLVDEHPLFRDEPSI